jgi:hypothetical protein
MSKYPRIALALLIGCAIAAVPSVLQAHFKAGSFPDLACEVVLLSGNHPIVFLVNILYSPSPAFWLSPNHDQFPH